VTQRNTSLLRRTSVLAVTALLGVGISATAAHADGWRVATAQGSGTSHEAGSANAQNNARAALTSAAAQAGEVCTSITSSATHVYTAPGGAAYVYNGTASGYCTVVPQPSYTVPRSASRQGGGSSASAAQSAGRQAAQADILAAGVACNGWSTSYAHVYTAPGGAWYIYNATVTAMCTN
jgi:hypothetical protein